MQFLTTTRKLKLHKNISYYNHYNLYGVQLYPNKTTCPSATKECMASCLVHSGMGKMPNVIKARKHRTSFYFQFPKLFNKLLSEEITKAKTKHFKQKEMIAVRLNTFSDLDTNHALLNEHKDVIFYDYTKRRDKLDEYIEMRPENYHITFSYSGRNMEDCLHALENDVSVTVVARTKKVVEHLFKGYRVIDGDDHDLRFMDEKGVIVWLRPKGVKKTISNDFIND